MKKNRLIGRHRPVTSVPHAGNQHGLWKTGLSFDGVQVVLLVPTSAPKPPLEYVEEFARDFQQMHKKSKMTTINDLYMETFKRLEHAGNQSCLNTHHTAR